MCVKYNCWKQVGALEALVELGCDPKVRDSVASTPMHVAAGEGHIQSILKLVDLVRSFGSLRPSVRYFDVKECVITDSPRHTAWRCLPPPVQRYWCSLHVAAACLCVLCYASPTCNVSVSMCKQRMVLLSYPVKVRTMEVVCRCCLVLLLLRLQKCAHDKSQT